MSVPEFVTFGTPLVFDPNRLNGYALLNASLALRPLEGAWRVALWGENLTDVYYWTIVTGNSDVNVRFAGMPRTFGASLSYTFD